MKREIQAYSQEEVIVGTLLSLMESWDEFVGEDGAPIDRASEKIEVLLPGALSSAFRVAMPESLKVRDVDLLRNVRLTLMVKKRMTPPTRPMPTQKSALPPREPRLHVAPPRAPRHHARTTKVTNANATEPVANRWRCTRGRFARVRSHGLSGDVRDSPSSASCSSYRAHGSLVKSSDMYGPRST